MKILLNKKCVAQIPRLHYSTNYQHLKPTRIPMYHFQKSLPRLPIPELEKTCERFLNAVQPIATDTEFESTRKKVENFAKNDGMKLQSLLQAHDKLNKNTSYISEPWFDMYLKDRRPLPVNYNPLLMMKHDERVELNDQSIRSTNLIINALRFYKSLRSETLEPEVFHLNPKKSDTDFYRNFIRLTPASIATYVSYAFKAYPLDMSQYSGLFCGTRLPKIGKDSIKRFDTSNHLIVFHQGRIYKLNVLDESGKIESPETIYKQINGILNNSNPIETSQQIGILTSENRDTWANVRKSIEESPENCKKLNEIDSAIFCLCLDDSQYNPDNPIPIIENFLYSNASNRWFDKSLTLIVSKDGTAGINFEHSWGDGVAVLRLFNEIFNETNKNPWVNKSTSKVSQTMESIEFDLNDSVKNSIKSAQESHNKILSKLEMNFFQTDIITRDFCKKFNVSPDSIMQLGFQLGFYKQTGKFVGTYESCSTAAFLHGRTETVRPCTKLTTEFCQKIVKNTSNRSELRELIDNCSKLHSTLTRDGAMGQGFDRHLFGLKKMAELDGKIPDLYSDELYNRINHCILSTSTLSAKGLLGGGFGPVVADGYGIGYNIQEKTMGSIITNYSDNRNGSDFIKCLSEGYNEICNLIKEFPKK